MKSTSVRYVTMLAGLLALWAAPVRAADPSVAQKLYTVGVSHLDTQWYFNIQETIRIHIPSTFSDTFKLFKQFPKFNFSWEGAYRYMLLEEYYPEVFAELLKWVEQGRWAPGGSALEAGDVNVPSPEALLRHFLIGNRYFREKLGKSSVDVFLPDCFGFGYALPTVASHCGLKGFSTQKLYWQAIVEIPFGIGVWKGVDGSPLISVLKPRGYTDAIDHDVSYDQAMVDNCSATFPEDGLTVGFSYYGVGDEGGPVRTGDAEWVNTSVLSDGPIQVQSAFSDQIFRDMTEAQVATLPVYDGELLMTTHGTGSYTSQGALKRWNRNNELLADATERAAVLADWMGVQSYPAQTLYATWVRFLAQHFHDVLPGTSTAEVYNFAWNDELIALNRFTSMLTDSVGALVQLLDTQVQGVPLVVYNPLALERSDLVEAVLRYDSDAPQHVAVFDPDGTEVVSQILDRGTAENGDAWVRLLFLAKAQGVGLTVYDVRPADAACAITTGLSVTKQGLQSDRYEVQLDESGDVAAIQDKLLGKALLASPIRLGIWDNNSSVWPAWEVLWSDLNKPAREFVRDAVEVKIVESGPARVALEVSRTAGASKFVQRISLAAGDAGNRVEVLNQVDWQTRSALLKAVFPLASANPEATYDLGVGTVKRPNNTERRYEVVAQQWVDLTAPDSEFGVTISSDSKYGWDKPNDGTLQLTLVNTPLDWVLSQLRYGQHTQDLGPHTFTYSIHGHTGDWQGVAWPVAARLNQPMLAFQTLRASGPQGRTFFPVTLSGGDVAVKALKKAEDGDGYVVRLVEMAGQTQNGVKLAFGTGLESAEELDGIEDFKTPATLTEGVLSVNFTPYQIRTYRIRPAKGLADLGMATTRVVPLEYNIDAISTNDDRADGALGPDEYDTLVSAPGEQIPQELVDGGIRFQLGSSAPGAQNAMECRGQSIELPATKQGDRIFLLAAGRGAQKCEFRVGEASQTVAMQNFTGFIGAWVGRVKLDKPFLEADEFLIEDPADFLAPFYHQDRIAWYTTHRHLADKDDPYKFIYLYRYELSMPSGASKVVMPDNPDCLVFAMSLSDSPHSRLVSASRTFVEHDPLHQPVDWNIMNAVEETVAPVEPSPEAQADAVTQSDAQEQDLVTDTGSKKSDGGCAMGSANSRGRPAMVLLLMALAAIVAFAHLNGRRRPTS